MKALQIQKLKEEQKNIDMRERIMIMKKKLRESYKTNLEIKKMQYKLLEERLAKEEKS